VAQATSRHLLARYPKDVLTDAALAMTAECRRIRG
jgi:hypothetical protein